MQEYYESVEIIFTEEHKPIKIFELSNFLYQLKTLYSWLDASEEFRIYEEKRKPEEITKDAKILADQILQLQKRMYYPVRMGYLFRKDLKDKDVFIGKINKESPLTIWFRGISTFLVAAFIICGGELEITTVPPRIKIKMSSLGEGIKRLGNYPLRG